MEGFSKFFITACLVAIATVIAFALVYACGNQIAVNSESNYTETILGVYETKDIENISFNKQDNVYYLTFKKEETKETYAVDVNDYSSETKIYKLVKRELKTNTPFVFLNTDDEKQAYSWLLLKPLY